MQEDGYSSHLALVRSYTDCYVLLGILIVNSFFTSALYPRLTAPMGLLSLPNYQRPGIRALRLEG